ncbi:3-hydroxyacyl-ACP dehydratase FabZ [Echinimonas agarilytica]|uniref:3-hydroxyacyl-[acyl-carrier-protein] dehydratase FabZ n=1 Tax=Echinimonas agarilytica TaxID=1215918 RepID=A0AA42B6W2_9GAMM|nr:3-hydroxyacyl-ACP dehydratase FabZ [Echinimonas agarilytica]MCM2679135.1 3-hydroxyacyl-ACP dehydratase FabZ [Echinimonas agarilytica]
MTKELKQLEIEEILKCLPHRYPFLLVDRVLDYEPNKTLHAIKNVSFNEPFFTGHFPQKPVFPGVLMLEAMAQATGILSYKSEESEPSENTLYYFASVDNARFKRPVGPGDTLHLEVELLKIRRGMGKFACVAKVDGAVVCSADIMCARREV